MFIYRQFCCCTRYCVLAPSFSSHAKSFSNGCSQSIMQFKVNSKSSLSKLRSFQTQTKPNHMYVCLCAHIRVAFSDWLNTAYLHRHCIHMNAVKLLHLHSTATAVGIEIAETEVQGHYLAYLCMHTHIRIYVYVIVYIFGSQSILTPAVRSDRCPS